MSRPEDQDLRDRSTGELVQELSRQVTTLVRQEIDLAKAEATAKGKRAGIGAGMFGGAGVAALLALAAFSAFLIIVLDAFLPLWLAALIVALLWAAVAGVLAYMGREKFEEAGPAKPEQTMDSVKEDVEWVKERTRSARR